MKVYPDKKTERICNGVFYGGIATIAVSVIMILLTILFGHGTAHVVLRVLGYAAFAAGGGLFAYAARIGIRPKFCDFFCYACIAVFVGGVMIAIDFAWVFGSIDPTVNKQVEQVATEAATQASKTTTTATTESHIGEMILAMTCFPIIALSAFFLIALVGADAKKQFYELTRDKMLCIGASCATAIAGLLAILLAIVKHEGVQTAAPWEEVALLVILLLAFGAPTVLLNGCSRLSDPVTDKELQEGFKMAEPPKKPADKEKKPSGKPDNAAKPGKPGKPDRDVKKGADGRKELSAKEPDKKGKMKPEADKKSKEAPEEDKKLLFSPKGKKDKDKDRDRKKPDDRKTEAEIQTDVISTTRKKPVESTNPTDLDAFLRKAEEEEERKERDAAWEAAREKKEAEKREIAETAEATVQAVSEPEPKQDKQDETVFSDKNSKKKDKKKDKDRRKKEKEKEKELRGVNTALFTNPNERRNEKRYIPTTSRGLDDSAEEKADEAAEAVINAVETVETETQSVIDTVSIAEAAGNVADVAETAAVVTEEAVSETIADEAAAAESKLSKGDGSFFGGSDSAIFEELERESAAVDAAEAAARAAAEVAEQSGSAFEMTEETAEWDARSEETVSEEELLKADQENEFRKIQDEIDRRLQERNAETAETVAETIDEAAETAEEVAAETVEEAAAAAETVEDAVAAAGTEITAEADAAGEFAEKVEETVEEAAGAVAEAATETVEAVDEVADKAGETVEQAVTEDKEESGEPKEESLADMLRRLGLIGKEETETPKAEEKAEEVSDTVEEAAANVTAAAEEIVGGFEETVNEVEKAEDAAEVSGETFGEAAEVAEETFNKAEEAAEAAAENVEEVYGAAEETAEAAAENVEEAFGAAEEAAEDAGFAFSERVITKPASAFTAAEEEKEDDTADLFSPVSVPNVKPVVETQAVAEEEEETFAFTPTDYVKSSFDKAMKTAEAERKAAEDVAEDLFAPVGTRPEKAEPVIDKPVAEIKPEPAAVQEEPEQDENELPDYERAPEISNANQAILWALKHGNSFADAAKASAAEAESKAKEEEAKAAEKAAEAEKLIWPIPKAEEPVAETFESAAKFADEAEEEPGSFAEAMAEALASSNEVTVTEAVDEPEPIVISDANSAILAAMEAARTRRMTEAVAPVQETVAEAVSETTAPAETFAEAVAETEETTENIAAEAEEEVADSFAAAMESAEAVAGEFVTEETEAAEETFDEIEEETFEEVAEAAEEAGEDFADALEAARERWANLEDDDGESEDEDELTEDSEYDSAEADEPEFGEAEFEQAEPEAESEEPETEEPALEEAETAESEPVNDGPIVPVYLQKQTMALSPEERARRAAAKASVVRNAPKQQKPAPATSVDTSMDEFTKKLKALKMAYENELITEEEFTEAKKHLLELL